VSIERFCHHPVRSQLPWSSQEQLRACFLYCSSVLRLESHFGEPLFTVKPAELLLILVYATIRPMMLLANSTKCAGIWCLLLEPQPFFFQVQGTACSKHTHCNVLMSLHVTSMYHVQGGAMPCGVHMWSVAAIEAGARCQAGHVPAPTSHLHCPGRQPVPGPDSE
jgi:hypothetical protein